MYLQLCIWCSGGRIISLGGKNEICALHDQKNTHNEKSIYPPPDPSFLPQYFVLAKILCFYCFWSLMSSRFVRSLRLTKTAPHSQLEFQFEARTVYTLSITGVNIWWKPQNDLFWASCQQVLGHNLKNLYHTKLKFNLQRLDRLTFLWLLWLKGRRDLRKSSGIPRCKSISIASFMTFLSIFGNLDSFTSANVVRRTLNFQRTCS